MDALGNPLKLFLTGGEVHDIVLTSDLLSNFSNCNVLADKGYDSAALVSDLESRDNTAAFRPDATGKIRGLRSPPLQRAPSCGMFFQQDETVSLIINAILWILYTGSPWRDLPEEFGSWKSVYTRFRRWAEQGIWEKVFAKFSEDNDLEAE